MSLNLAYYRNLEENAISKKQYCRNFIENIKNSQCNLFDICNEVIEGKVIGIAFELIIETSIEYDLKELVSEIIRIDKK